MLATAKDEQLSMAHLEEDLGSRIASGSVVVENVPSKQKNLCPMAFKIQADNQPTPPAEDPSHWPHALRRLPRLRGTSELAS